MLGQNDSGDFDQLSIAGVDFGADYCADFGVIPTNLEGEDTMYGNSYNQMGERAYGMGIIPEGLGADFTQLGIVPQGLNGEFQQVGLIPSGMSGQYNQMGGQYNQMGGIMDQLKTPLFTVAGFSVTPIILAGVGAALFLAHRQGMFKKLGL